MKKLKPHAADWPQIDRFLASADKKLVSARKILAFDEEACLQQAYEAMLKSSLGFMFSHGFRARSQPGHHIAIIDFVRSRIDKKNAGLLLVFDRLRRKRNMALYDDTGFVSRHDAEKPAISSRFTYWLLEESYNPRFPYFWMRTEAGFISPCLCCCAHKAKYILTQLPQNSIAWLMLQCSNFRRSTMPTTAISRTHSPESSFVNLLSGWAQQGVQSFFATQRILMDLATRQKASLTHSVRQQVSDPNHSPTAILSEATAESVKNFIEGQRVLLELGQKQNEILMTGVKERVGDWPPAQTITDLLQRSVETFVHMQQEFLKIADKQTHTWVEAAKAGKPYQSKQLVETAREAMDNFVKAQKHFMDVIAEETAKATGAKHTNGVRKTKKTELSQLARHATESFIDAQRKLVDVAGRQMNANVKTVGKTLELLRPFPFLPLGELTREGVKSYVDAQKELMNVMVKPGAEHKHAHKVVHRAKRSPKKHAAAVA